MIESGLDSIYRDYIGCLNRQDWPELGRFVHDEVCYNGELIRLPGYRRMLEKDFREILDLQFAIDLLICEPPHVAVRLKFDCAPKGIFLGLGINGRRVSFTENVFYKFAGWKIIAVWSVIDKAAIEAQLQGRV